MKTITLINWIILGSYALILLWLLFFTKSQSDDGMAKGLLMLCFIPLGILVVLNLLPYPFARTLVLVLSSAPLIFALIGPAVSSLLNKKMMGDYDQELRDRANGTFYFKDSIRQQLAAAIASRDIAQLKSGLQQPPANLNQSGEEHITLLDFATIQARSNPQPADFACLELLMDKGATVETNDKERSATHFLVLESDPSLLEWFLKKGANPNAREAQTGKPILFNALYTDKSDTLKVQRIGLLLNYGADPNLIPPQYDERVIVTSILLAAADNEQWAICQLLLDKGANPDYQTKSGWTIDKAVNYQVRSYRDRGETPPAELTALSERLQSLRKQ